MRNHDVRNKAKGTVLLLLLAVLMALALTLTACGSSDEEEEVQTQGSGDFAYEVDPYSQMSDAELEALKQKADLMNKDVENFYGTWQANEEEAYNLYGGLKITINEDGTFDADVGQGEEVFSGTWKKTDDGVSFKSELLNGTFFYGETCLMTIDNSEWDYDGEDSGMAVTLEKVD